MIPKLDYYKERWNVASESSIKPGLAAMEEALHRLGNPEKTLRVIHVAGTNGKGSTIAFLDALAASHVLKVGKFMSPCVLDVHDQIQVNQTPIAPNALEAIFEQFAIRQLSGILTDFELLTCAAFLHFANENVDVAIIETGMGGKLDSTNVVNPIVSVITSIALEHTNFLGKTIEEITAHKAGIIKQRRPVIVGVVPNEALHVIQQTANNLNAPLAVYGEQFEVIFQHDGESYANKENGVNVDRLNRQMLGNHQRINMGLAITAFLLFAKETQLEINEEKVREAIASAALPGRFEEVLPNVYFEGAHNPASVQALVQILQQHFANYHYEFLIGMLRDKDVNEVLKQIEPIATSIGFLSIDNERALPAQQFYALSEHPNKYMVHDAIEAIQAPLPDQSIRIVTGSLYLLAQLREKLRNMEK